MTNPNPFVPEGSILELQSKRRSRLKIAVFCVLAVSVAGLAAMLIQGCKREQPTESGETPSIDTNAAPVIETNAAPIETNAPVVPPPVTNAPVVTTPPPAAAATEYTIVQGDTLAAIAKNHGVTLKALEDANPNVVPTKLQIGHQISIPASTGATSAPTDLSGTTYKVKSGDNLTRIARRYGTTVKAIEAENNLPSAVIKVGQILKIPAKAEAPAAAPTEPATVAPAPATPVTPPDSTPAR